MGLQDPERVQATLLRARELPHDQRQPFLDELRGIDPELCRDVELLLGELPKPPDPNNPRMSGDEAGAETVWVGSADPHKIASVGPGVTISGYQVVEKIADGGMGTVWRAIQIGNRRPVALKAMRFGTSSDKQRARFELEMQASARLEHINIARVYDSRIEGSMLFYVMELIDGPRLDQYVRHNRCTPEGIARLLMGVCDAVQVAHDAGIIHRDLKPSNILVTQSGVPKVLDFGLAKLEHAGQQSLTLTGDIAGTPHYMPPEQAAGQLGAIGPASDVYSLGVILYELLTGTTPFRGNLTAILHQILRDDPKPPRDLNHQVPHDLEAICLKAMAREPSQRYASAAQMRQDLERFCQAEPVLAKPASTLTNIARWLSHPRRILNAGILDIIQGWLLLVWNLEGVIELTLGIYQGPKVRTSELAVLEAMVILLGAVPTIVAGHLILKRWIFPLWMVVFISTGWLVYLGALVLGLGKLDFAGFYPKGPFRNTIGSLLCLWCLLGVVSHLIALLAYYTHRTSIGWLGGVEAAGSGDSQAMVTQAR